jgi:DNA (cytosine-5)-methyltransferase 1
MNYFSKYESGILIPLPKEKLNECNKSYKLGELFSGPGGLALGAYNSCSSSDINSLCITHSWATDNDFNSCQTYMNNYNLKSSTVIQRDIHELDINSLPEIDCFAYGFPCNDFSILGEKKGFDGKYGPLYKYGIKVINKFIPDFFVAENVSGLSSNNDGIALKKILKDLSEAGNGYNLTPHLYKSEEYGISQTRHRIIIVGIKNELNKKFKVPAPITKENYIPVKNILANISSSLANNENTRQSLEVVNRLKFIKPGENAWNADIPEYLQLNVKGARLSQIYKRLHPDKPSYTITGSGGGGTHGYHWEEHRALTNRERARIQSFPDNFIFYGSKESVRKQIGMAVPPLLSKIIFTSILHTLNNVRYESVTENIKFDTEVSLFK